VTARHPDGLYRHPRDGLERFGPVISNYDIILSTVKRDGGEE